MPDLTDVPEIPHESMRIWKKANKKDRKKPHNMLPGICAKYANTAIDFAIEHCKWPVVFIKPGEKEKTDLTEEFVLYVWLRYSSQMTGKPTSTTNAAQKVLKYLLVYRDLVVRAWRNRIYYYSSGSTFKRIASELQFWCDEHDPENPISDDTDEEDQEKPEKIVHDDEYRGPRFDKLLRGLDDLDDLHEILGDTMISFIKTKPTAFPNATLSQADMWKSPTWKRAMTWVFLLRFLLDKSGQKQWKKFSYDDYKLNVRAFERWIQKDTAIMSSASEFRNMPETLVTTKRTGSKGNRGTKRSRANKLRNPSTDKRTCVISLVSTDDEEDS